MRIIAIAVLVLMTLVELTQAEPRKRHESKNYIIRRQQAGSVTGVPILRRIRGSREIDIYRDGSMFEKDNFVGFNKR
jgi:hypothetical protein